MYKPEEKKIQLKIICSAVVSNKYCLKYSTVNSESTTNAYMYMTVVRVPGPQFPNSWFMRHKHKKIKLCLPSLMKIFSE